MPNSTPYTKASSAYEKAVALRTKHPKPHLWLSTSPHDPHLHINRRGTPRFIAKRSVVKK